MTTKDPVYHRYSRAELITDSSKKSITAQSLMEIKNIRTRQTFQDHQHSLRELQLAMKAANSGAISGIRLKRSVNNRQVYFYLCDLVLSDPKSILDR